MKNKQISLGVCGRGAFFSLFVLLGAYIAICKPIAGMASGGQHVLAGAIVMIGMWIIKPFGIPFAISSLFFVVVALANKLPGDKIFIGFTGNALWVLISALFFGYVLITTGLGKRFAYIVIFGVSNLWRPTYLTLMIAWVIIGVLLSALTASIAVRVSIVTPIALSFLEACKIEPRSRGAALILLTAWFCAMVPGSGLLTGSLYGPIIQGMFNGEASLHGIVDSLAWLEVMA
ncbi:MAG: anion permease, partial [Syntrophobacterales bacterium]|nr:anion permease [Syntrophobacterales bacterium]